MTRDELIRRLKDIGFEERCPGAIKVTTRLVHRSVAGGSVFVGEGTCVSCSSPDNQTPLRGAVAFLIANGSSRGMTKELGALDRNPTGTIPDPDKRPSPDDPYWRDATDLRRLLDAMERHFAPGACPTTTISRWRNDHDPEKLTGQTTTVDRFRASISLAAIERPRRRVADPDFCSGVTPTPNPSAVAYADDLP